jgi:hypothetical protein
MKHCAFRAYAKHVLEYNSWASSIALRFGALSPDIVAQLCSTAIDISQRFRGLIAQA